MGRVVGHDDLARTVDEPVAERLHVLEERDGLRRCERVQEDGKRLVADGVFLEKPSLGLERHLLLRIKERADNHIGNAVHEYGAIYVGVVGGPLPNRFRELLPFYVSLPNPSSTVGGVVTLRYDTHLESNGRMPKTTSQVDGLK